MNQLTFLIPWLCLAIHAHSAWFPLASPHGLHGFFFWFSLKNRALIASPNFLASGLMCDVLSDQFYGRTLIDMLVIRGLLSFFKSRTLSYTFSMLWGMFFLCMACVLLIQTSEMFYFDHSIVSAKFFPHGRNMIFLGILPFFFLPAHES